MKAGKKTVEGKWNGETRRDDNNYHYYHGNGRRWTVASFWFQTSEIESHVCLGELGVVKSTEAGVWLVLKEDN